MTIRHTALDVIALDLEGTLISNVVSQFPRVGALRVSRMLPHARASCRTLHGGPGARRPTGSPTVVRGW